MEPLGGLEVGRGRCEKVLGMAGEMLCFSSVVPLEPFQRAAGPDRPGSES